MSASASWSLSTERLLEFGEVLGADQDGGLATVARDHDAVVLALDAIDQLGKMVADGT